MEDQIVREGLRYSMASPRNSIRDLFVDFLGSLVPGVTFIITATFGFTMPFLYLIWVLGGRNQDFISHFIPSGISGQISLGAVVLLVLPAAFLFLVIAYVAGQIFFRQDPRRADLSSAKLLDKKDVAASMVRMANGVSMEQSDVEFPYLFLHEYLTRRGLTHLASHVPWQGCNKCSHKHRTKHYMNTLKTPLEFSYPNRVGTIVRNEAHVRLASSMWYLCRTVKKLSSMGVLIAGIASGWYGYSQYSQLGDLLSTLRLEMIVIPLMILVSAWWTQRNIEKALHYQREREVLFILETAHWAGQRSAIDMFDGLTRPRYHESLTS